MTYPGLHQDQVKKLQFPGHSQFFVTHPQICWPNSRGFPIWNDFCQNNPCGEKFTPEKHLSCPKSLTQMAQGNQLRRVTDLWEAQVLWQQSQALVPSPGCSRVGKPGLLAAVQLSTWLGHEVFDLDCVRGKGGHPCTCPWQRTLPDFPFWRFSVCSD